MRLPLFPLELPFGVWGLLATQKTPRTTSYKKKRTIKNNKRGIPKRTPRLIFSLCLRFDVWLKRKRNTTILGSNRNYFKIVSRLLLKNTPMLTVSTIGFYA